VTADPSASIWEVTRLILDSPDRSPSEIAQEHGYTAAEIAELMPIFLDTARTDWSVAADTASDWATPTDPDAELYLRDLAGSGSIEVAGFDTAPDVGVLDLDVSGYVAADAQQGWTSADEPLPPDLGELLDGPGPGVPLGSTADGPSGVTGPEPDGVGGEPRVVDGAPPELDGTAEGAGPYGALLVDGGVTGLPAPDDGFELGEDDPFETGPYADEPLGHSTGPDLPDEPSDAGFDDAAGSQYAG
jgi:hypothetical protein